MMDDFSKKAASYLQTLCSVQPNRRTGSPGNQQAVDFFAQTIRPFGYELDLTQFSCLDYLCESAFLSHAGTSYDIRVSPYSLACDTRVELVAVSSVEELTTCACTGKILLMHGEICSEQLMPKNFVFYNPENHQALIALLEQKKPAAIITATGRNPELVGALYPFPLFVDGDFDIPSVYCTEAVGQQLLEIQGGTMHLKIASRRLPATTSNVIARLNPRSSSKLVFTAHIDAYEDAPGASDNASGVVILLLLAELLKDYRGPHCLEIIAINGEDHYSAAGQMDYLKRYADSLSSIHIAINIDDIGYIKGRSAFSFYQCPPPLESNAIQIFQSYPGLVAGEPWFQGDHMIFVQQGIPAIAFTSENMLELMRTITHTALDTPAIVDTNKLVELAAALNALVRTV